MILKDTIHEQDPWLIEMAREKCRAFLDRWKAARNPLKTVSRATGGELTTTQIDAIWRTGRGSARTLYLLELAIRELGEEDSAADDALVGQSEAAIAFEASPAATNP